MLLAPVRCSVLGTLSGAKAVVEVTFSSARAQIMLLLAIFIVDNFCGLCKSLDLKLCAMYWVEQMLQQASMSHGEGKRVSE